MNCDDPEYGCPFCCSCDKPAALRCPECGEFYCAECFGPDHAEAWSPCQDCALKLAPPDVIVENQAGRTQGPATPAATNPVSAKYNPPQ
jgi:hypothetical protein